MRQFPPRRLICLTEETTEALYLLGEQDRIVGISGYTVRPPAGAAEKPRVSAHSPRREARQDPRSGARLVSASPTCRPTSRASWARRRAVHLFNQRDVAGIFAMSARWARWSARATGPRRCAFAEAGSIECARRTRPAAPAAGVLRGMGRAADQRDPLGVGADRIAGGDDIFPELRGAAGARDRIVADAA